MRKIWVIGAAGVAGAAVAVWWMQAGAGARPGGLFAYDDPATLAAGRALYDANCASCHGATLEGQDDWRGPLPGGRMPAPPHDATGHTWHHPDSQLFDLTKYGVAALVGGGYESDMAGFEAVLSDVEIRAVLAYVKSTWPERIIRQHDEINARSVAD